MDKTVSFAIDYGNLDSVDETLKTLLIGALHDEAPDNVTVWGDVPNCIRSQYDSTVGLIHDWALNNLDVVEDQNNPPRIHVNWMCRVPDNLIPWGDPGNSDWYPMGVTLQMEWLDPQGTVVPADLPAR